MGPKKNYLWVVEMNFSVFGDDWQPTVGVALNRSDGRVKLKEWRSRCVNDRFRLEKYVPNTSK